MGSVFYNKLHTPDFAFFVLVVDGGGTTGIDVDRDDDEDKDDFLRFLATLVGGRGILDMRGGGCMFWGGGANVVNGGIGGGILR